ncbi:MAG: hypothetical protein NTV97_22695 [Alphaproteobacteria bacterium]|nr:hypothetical protein [Alphaproteobacteria bacterium]
MSDPKSKEDRAEPEAKPEPDQAPEHWRLDEREAAGAVRFTLVGEHWERREPKTPSGE